MKSSIKIPTGQLESFVQLVTSLELYEMTTYDEGKIYVVESKETGFYAKSSNELVRIWGDGEVYVPFTMKINASDSTFTIPIVGGGKDYDVDWGDGTFDQGLTQAETHTYSSTGEYVVKVYRNVEQIQFYQSGEEDKVLDIMNWGDIVWGSMFYAFFGCSNLDCSAADYPDVSIVQNFNSTFRGCTSLATLDVSNWDVSSVTDMSLMFFNTSITTLDVSNWDVSSVTNMDRMFYGCTSLTTLDVSNWDVSSVTNMNRMFYGCTSLTTLDVSNWDVSSVTDMGIMFRNTSITTLDVSSWDVSSVTNMSIMFRGASLTTLDVSNWDVSSVTDMSGMFRDTSITTLDVSSWDVSSVTNMNTMFYGCTSLTTLDVSSWDVSSVTDMGSMFRDTPLLEIDIKNWVVVNVTNAGYFKHFGTIADYDQVLCNWSAQALQSGVNIQFANAQYSPTGEICRNDITTTYSWNITDGGPI